MRNDALYAFYTGLTFILDLNQLHSKVFAERIPLPDNVGKGLRL